MYGNEKQFNSRASEHAIEEVYTNNDISTNDLKIIREGYEFRYPQRWLDDPSQNKAIGIRRLDIKPTHHIINYRIDVVSSSSTMTRDTLETDINETTDKITDEDKNIYQQSITKINGDGTTSIISKTYFSFIGRIEVLPENTLMEILNKMFDEFTQYANETVYSDGTHKFAVYYDYSDNKLTIMIYDLKSYLAKGPTFAIYDYLDIDNANEYNYDQYALYRFLNQPEDKFEDDDQIFKEIWKFENVWDRDYIQFHASFSDSNRNFIGLRNDFYHKPSIIYRSPNDGSTFYIRFTTDGKSPILPLYCRFVVQLCFLVNYKKAIVF